jgi:hypothetical protein
MTVTNDNSLYALLEVILTAHSLSDKDIKWVAVDDKLVNTDLFIVYIKNVFDISSIELNNSLLIRGTYWIIVVVDGKFKFIDLTTPTLVSSHLRTIYTRK